MKLRSLMALFLALTEVPSLAKEEVLTIERLYSSPELAGKVPRGLRFSGDGKRLMFLGPKPEDFEVLDLWEYDLQTGEPRLLLDSKKLNNNNLSEQEKARLERMRITHSGITEFVLSQEGDKIVIPYHGELYYFHKGLIKTLGGSKGAAIDIKFSPHDQFISYVRNQNLYIRKPNDNSELALTKDGKNTISYGVAEFVAQEEMDRFSGYWWSKDESYIALTQVDESKVKLVSRYEVDADSVKVHEERYPEAGGANAVVKLGVVKISEALNGRGNIHWIPLGESSDFYLARVDWTPTQKLVYQIQSRDQKTLLIYEYDPKTKKQKELFRESNDHWINLNTDLHFLEKSGRFIWGSERNGFKHLYLYNSEGRLIKPLTQGLWNVDEVHGVDEQAGWIYFTAALKSPLEKHLYRVGIEATGDPEPLTREEGWHTITMNKTATNFLDNFSSNIIPPRVFLNKANGERVSDLSQNEMRAGHPLFPYIDTLIAPEFGSFTGSSGELIYYRIYKPRNFKKGQKYPLVITGYGGPTGQVVTKRWQDLSSQIFVNQGFVLASFDNRGTLRRGRKFADALYHSFGTVEVEDQVAGLKHLISLGYVDESRVGFYGWSYGGYLSLMLAGKTENLYRSNLAIAPVTDFALYDTHYTERYLGKPQDEKPTYQQANALNLSFGKSGRLMIIHGMSDDNVLFTNSTLLFKKLQAAGIIYESVTYPGGKHGLTGKSNQIHLLKTILDFFERTLKP